jgi:flagellar protein FliO/FliZ
MPASSAWTSLLAFVAVLALIPIVLWLLKRSPVGGQRADGIMRTVATLPIAPNQRLVTIEVGAGEERRWLVLGVTPGQISTLWTMPPQGPAPSAPVNTPNAQFSQLLGRLRGVDSGLGGPPHGR